MKSSVEPRSALLNILGAKWPQPCLDTFILSAFMELRIIHLYFLLHFMLRDRFEMLDAMTIFRQNGPKNK